MLNVLGMIVDRYDGVLPWRIPAKAPSRKRSARSSWRSCARRNSSWASVRGANASATSSGTGSARPSWAVPEPAPGTRAAGAERVQDDVAQTRVAGDERVGERRRKAGEVRAHRVQAVAPQARLHLPL